MSHSAEKTLIHILIHALPILMHWLGFRISAAYRNICLTYLITLSRLSAPYLFPCITYFNTLSRLSALADSAANQNRVLRHTRSPASRQHPSPRLVRIEYNVTRVVSQSKLSITSPESNTLGSQQPIRIEYYVTRELPALGSTRVVG